MFGVVVVLFPPLVVRCEGDRVEESEVSLRSTLCIPLCGLCPASVFLFTPISCFAGVVIVVTAEGHVVSG